MQQKCLCGSSYKQELPTVGIFGFKVNLPLESLRKSILNSEGTIYSYVIATIKNTNNHFEQTGCGPNFEGGLFTLCTCKHFMRTFKMPQDWVGIWIAGFAGIDSGRNKTNALVYLMKVEFAFPSFGDLWNSVLISQSAKSVKSTANNPLGDFYEPKDSNNEPYKHQNYKLPCEEHVHRKNDRWIDDIEYSKGMAERKPALLIGEVINSYLWNNPQILFDEHLLHRGQKKTSMTDFLDSLKE